MFMVAYSSSNGSRYMRIIEARRRGGKVEHRHLLSLEPHEALAFERYRAILAGWKLLVRAVVVRKAACSR